MLTDPVKIMQLQNCLTVAKRAHYNGEKETKLASFFKRNCRYMHIERTANGVTVREKTAMFHIYRAFQYNAVLTIMQYGRRCRINEGPVYTVSQKRVPLSFFLQ